MHSIQHDIHIDAGPDQVWSVLADLGSFADWSPVVRRVEHAGADGVGATRTCHVAPMGRLDEEVIDWEPGRRMALRTTGGMPMTATATWTVEPASDGTRAAVRLDYELKGGAAGRLLDRVMVRRQFDRNFARNLEGLRDHVEATRSRTGATPEER